MKAAPRFASAFSAQSTAACPRGDRRTRSSRTLTLVPIWYAIWSPVHAPAAATSMISPRLGVPFAIATADRAMTIDSLGIGGKNPSIVANR